jgi:foldase protein PrsA
VRRFPLFLVVAALVAGLVTSACGDTVRPSAATVNGEHITQEDLDLELQAIEGNKAYVESVQQGGFEVLGKGHGTLTNDFVGRVLTRQIFLFLVHQEVVRKKLTITEADLDASKEQVLQSLGGDRVFNAFPKAYRDVLMRRNAEVTKLQSTLGGEEVTDEAVKAFYDANQALFAQTCVSHILFAVTSSSGELDQEATAAQIDRLKGEAEAARAEIAGGADFAAIAAQRSADASNKASGGDLECGPAGRFVPEFETAMDALAVNEVSAPVQTQFGVHLIKVTDRKPQSLEEATPQIQSQLQSESEQEFTGFLQAALTDAKVTINPRYGTFNKEGQSPGVVPPGAPTTTVPGDVTPPAGEGQLAPLQP